MTPNSLTSISSTVSGRNHGTGEHVLSYNEVVTAQIDPVLIELVDRLPNLA